MVLAVAPAGDAAQKPHGVGMPGLLEDLLRRSLLHDLAGVHDPDAVTHLGDHGEVVTDEQHRGVELLAEQLHKVEHFGLDGRVEGGGRLVQDQQGRFRGQRHGDDDPLQHAPRELVRVRLEHPSGIGDLDRLQRLLGALECLALAEPGDLEDLGNLTPDADRGVECATGLLVHHRDRARPHRAQRTFVQRSEVLAVHGDRPRAEPPVTWQVSRDRERHRRLAGAGFPDEPERLVPADLERDVSQRQPVLAPDPVGHLCVIDLERERLVLGGVEARRGFDGHCASTDSIASETRLTATTSEAMASAGKSVSHQ